MDAATYKVLRLLPTGRGAHGLYVSRDSRHLYVSNRGEGSVSVVSFQKRKVVDVWRIPGGGSPDIGQYDRCRSCPPNSGASLCVPDLCWRPQRWPPVWSPSPSPPTRRARP
ncbi:YncE family protein [Microbispora bryophytorum]|uniref:YncE family protein n=1 Tax=Microbispora bryophytorum TaxID=1460882 RepID=UPI00115A199D|nr:hypothetical protein FLX07_11870 [Microbispora bryophytorum]